MNGYTIQRVLIRRRIRNRTSEPSPQIMLQAKIPHRRKSTLRQKPQKAQVNVMFLWDRTDWTEFYGNADVRRGLRVRYEHGIDTDLKESIKRFILWIRRNYYFPFRVVIYIKSSEFITAKDGDLVSGTFFEPYYRTDEPYIRVAAGDHAKNLIRWGRDDAIAATLRTIAHELTHYYQWINGVDKPIRNLELQAYICSSIIIRKYAETTEHP